MFDRFLSILPTLLFALGTGAIATWRVWYLITRQATSNNLEGRLKNIRFELSKLGIVAMIVAPCFEESIYRAPLIVGFAATSSVAWLMICHVGLLFGYVHVTSMHTRLYQGLPSSMGQFFLGRLWHVCQAGLLGIALGYLAIQFQSLVVPIALHMVWNASVFFFGMRRNALREARGSEAMGNSIDELPLGRSFTLHLQEGPNQIPHSYVLFENGWNTAPKVGDSFSLLLEDRNVLHEIYKIRASETEAHAFALPIER